MRLSFLFFSALACASSLVRVNDKNFKEAVIDTGKFTLVDFYADWCRHCQKLMPTIEQLADLYKDTKDVRIVKINGDADGRKMTRKYQIEGFPMLLMFHGDDKPVEYKGGRDLESISNFVQQLSGARLGKDEDEDDDEVYFGDNLILEVNDENIQESVLNADHATIVAFVADNCEHSRPLKPVWKKLAHSIYDQDGSYVKFARVDLSEPNKGNVPRVVSQFGISQTPTILYFNPKKQDADGLKRPVPFYEERDVETLIKFINTQSGLKRDAKGELTDGAGRIEHLEGVLSSLSKDSAENVLGTIEELAENVLKMGRHGLVDNGAISVEDDVSMLPYYQKLAQKVASGDTEYASKELARLEKMVSENTTNIRKPARDYIRKRINILRIHLGK